MNKLPANSLMDCSPSPNSVFTNLFIETIREFRLINYGESILVAVSGGIDSMSLLYCLYNLRHYLGIKINCATYDHQIRPSSKEEVLFVKAFCKKLSIPFYSSSANVTSAAKLRKKGIEETAREYRYGFLFATANEIKADKIATAHHLDDFAENFIMRLVTGSGSGSIAGIQVRNGILIRPLIKHSKEEITKFARLNSIKFCEDYTNKDAKIFRNYIRLNIIPGLKKFNKSFLKTIYNTSEILRKDDEFITDCALKIYNNAKLKLSEKGNYNAIIFKTDSLLNIPEAALYRIVKKAALDINFNKDTLISYRHFKIFKDLLRNKKPNIFFNVNKIIRIKKSYNNIIFENINQQDHKIIAVWALDENLSRGFSNKNIDFFDNENYKYILNQNNNLKESGNLSIDIKELGKTFIIRIIKGRRAEKIRNGIENRGYNKPCYETSEYSEPVVLKNNKNIPSVENYRHRRHNACFFDIDKLLFPITIRNFKEGDKFIPLGMNGHKKLKDYFIDNKIPLEIRRVLPLVLFKDEIVWIGGSAISDIIKVTKLTKNIGIMKFK